MKKITPLKIVIIFFVSSLLWVILTDLLLAEITTTPEVFAKLSIMKGGFYFLVTGLLLYWLVSRYASDRDLAENSLRFSEQSYKTLAENLPGIVYRVFARENSRIKFFNKTSLEIVGYSDSELSQGEVCSLESLIHREDRPRVIAAVKKAITAHNIFTVEYRLFHKDGGIRYVIENGVPIYAVDGNLLYIDGVIFDISERKQVEEALAKSEERFRAFMNNSPTIAWMKDEQGRYVYMSKNAEDRFGIRFNDVRGCTDFQIWPQEFAEVFRKNDLKVLESGQPIDVEETAGFNGNLSIWWNFRFPFRDAAGQRYVGGIGVEITQRREAENELKRTQSNIAAIIESTEDMIWSVDLKYRMVTFNSALQKHVLRTYGMNVFIGAEPEDFLPRDRAETWVSTYVRALSEGPFRMEYTLADGRILEISCNVILQDGQTAGISVFAKDITERKLIETALQESEERFRRAVVVAPFPVMMHAEDGEILAVSNKLIELTGYAFEDINTVQKWTEKVYARKSPVMYEHIQKLFERDRIDEGIELDIITRNGNTLNWFFRASPLGRLSDGRKLLISMAVDITERKRIEEERIERKSAERAMDKVLMDIHDGIGGITTNISLISELAKKKTSTPMIIEEALNTISDLARDGMAEIRSLMYSLDREDLDWHSLVIELRSQGIKLLEPHSIEFNMTTEVKEEIPNPSSHLCLTLFRIYREALLNVLKHAKATRVTVTFHVDREHLTIVIRDNGQGFRHSALTRNGRGIGNMMTRAVEMHGTVTVTGEGGTKVAIEFPLSSK